MITRTLTSTAFTAIIAAAWALPASAQTGNDPLSLDLEVYGGRSVVPPDIIENDIDQVRIEEVIGSDVTVTYREGDTRVFVGAGVQVFPAESLFNRYGLAVGASQDIPLAQDGRIRLRLGGTYDHVLGDEGRVFNRVRGDAQLIARHGGGHTSVARARYGYRNQSEERFQGFDQSELLGELRHTYRPQGSQSSVSVAAFVLDVDAEDDRFSFRGLGLRVLGRALWEESLPVLPAPPISIATLRLRLAPLSHLAATMMSGASAAGSSVRSQAPLPPLLNWATSTTPPTFQPATSLVWWGLSALGSHSTDVAVPSQRDLKASAT